jgi:alpha-1,2-mannosyltransferase
MSVKSQSTTERVVLVLIALATLVSGLYFARKSGTNADAYSNDFNVYYHAAREVIAGRDPYQHSLGAWTPYLYPPLLSELMVPLAVLPLPVASYFWFLISAFSTLAAAWMSADLATDRRDNAGPQPDVNASTSWRRAIAACALIVVLRFVLDTFNLGQVNALVAALAVAHVYLYARGRRVLSAVALVIAVSIKLTPALLLVYHLARLRFKFAVACAALLVGVTVISFLPFGQNGADAFHTFWNRTVNNEQGYNFAYSGNQSLRGAIARLSGNVNDELPPNPTAGNPVDLTTLLISLVLLATAVFAAVRARTELAAAAPFFCCLILLSPLSWKAHYVMLILPAAYLISRVRASKSRLIAAMLAAAFVLFNVTSPRVIGLAAAEWADGHSLVVGGALVVFLGCAFATWLTQRSTSASGPASP